MSYQINKINKEIIQILDEYYDCIYVIKGEKKSLVISVFGNDYLPVSFGLLWGKGRASA